ncbi:MAG: hypothetical protein MI807_12915 [Verrucomicrobiales bacterium]|nr:hypothetical protein [Verrucomicrobiales bacterium]
MKKKSRQRNYGITPSVVTELILPLVLLAIATFSTLLFPAINWLFRLLGV